MPTSANFGHRSIRGHVGIYFCCTERPLKTHRLNRVSMLWRKQNYRTCNHNSFPARILCSQFWPSSIPSIPWIQTVLDPDGSLERYSKKIIWKNQQTTKKARVKKLVKIPAKTALENSVTLQMSLKNLSLISNQTIRKQTTKLLLQRS